MDKLEHLKLLVSENIEREKSKLALAENKEIFQHHCLSFKGINAIFFINSYYLNNDLIITKNCLYKIGMTNSYYHEMYNGEIFNVLDTFVYPVLADSQSLIERYLAYTKTEHEDSFSTFFGKGIQCLWRKDNEGLAHCIEGLEKSVGGGWEKSYSGIVTSFKGFLRNNAKGISDGITELTDKHNEQNQPLVIKDYINFQAAAIAKLAIEHGYTIEDDNRLVPYTLLRSEPNEKYVGYSFFDEIN